MATSGVGLMRHGEQPERGPGLCLRQHAHPCNTLPRAVSDFLDKLIQSSLHPFLYCKNKIIHSESTLRVIDLLLCSKIRSIKID